MRPMKPYSEDLRVRIVSAVQEESMSKSAAARLFGVSLSSLKRYARMADRGTTLAPRKKGGGRPPKADETTRRLPEEDVKERPAATVTQRRQFLESTTGKALSDSTVGRLLRRMGFTRKNGVWGHWNGMSSEERPGGGWCRRGWSRSGWFSWTRWGRTSPFLSCGLGRDAGSGRTARYPATAGRILPCF